MRYLMNLIYDPEYEGYVADVPQLPGCMSQGKTLEQAIDNAKDAIRTYLEELDEDEPRGLSPVLTAQVEL